MRNLTSSLVTLGLAGIIAGGIAVGCSADGSTDVAGDTTGTDQNGTDPGTNNPAPSDTGSMGNPMPTGAGSKDAGSKADNTGMDSGSTTGGGKDAGPPAPNAGDPCSALNTVYTKSCGFCGTQQAACIANGDGGGGKVSDYSTCTGEVAGGCTPGTTQMEACGLCGTHQKICQNNCQWQAGSCTGEPAGACQPGYVTNTGAGCGAGTYRQQTCGNDCKQGNLTATCGPYVNPVTLSVGAVGATVTASQDVEPVVGKTWSLYSGSCPVSSASDINADYPSDYVEVDNNTGKAAKVTIFQSVVAGGSEFDTVLFVYSGSTPPTTDAAKQACTGTIADSCAAGSVSGTYICGTMDSFSFASLQHVAIPVGGKILVYSGGYGSSETGKLQINIKTESLL